MEQIKFTTEEEFYTWLGGKVKTLRERKGLNPNQLAEQIGIPRALLVAFEDNGKKLSAWRINQLLDFFNMPTINNIVEEYSGPEKKVCVTALA